MLRSAHRLRRRDSQGFALPLAVAGAMLLLLSSSSLQMLALHNRSQLARQQRRLQIEDTLASAAHQQIARLGEYGSCLLGLDQAQWPSAAPDCALSAEALATLQQGQVGADTYRVAAYRPLGSEPQATGAELELQLGGSEAWRAGYRLSLAPSGAAGLRVTAVQELGLRGVGA